MMRYTRRAAPVSGDGPRAAAIPAPRPVRSPPAVHAAVCDPPARRGHLGAALRAQRTAGHAGVCSPQRAPVRLLFPFRALPRPAFRRIDPNGRSLSQANTRTFIPTILLWSIVEVDLYWGGRR